MPSLQSALSAQSEQSEQEERSEKAYETDGSAAREEEFKPVRTDAIGYDLSRFDQRPDVREARRVEAAGTPSRRRKEKERPRVNAVSLLLAAAAAGLAVLLIYNYMQLTVLNDRLAARKAEYQDLVNQGVLLKTQYESRYDLTQIEEYAQAKLGMTKMDRSQIEYVEIGSPDTITRKGGAGSGKTSFMTAFTKKMNAILAFFS